MVKLICQAKTTLIIWMTDLRLEGNFLEMDLIGQSALLAIVEQHLETLIRTTLDE